MWTINEKIEVWIPRWLRRVLIVNIFSIGMQWKYLKNERTKKYKLVKKAFLSLNYCLGKSMQKYSQNTYEVFYKRRTVHLTTQIRIAKIINCMMYANHQTTNIDVIKDNFICHSSKNKYRKKKKKGFQLSVTERQKNQTCFEGQRTTSKRKHNHIVIEKS